MTFMFLGLPKHLQSTQRILELIDEINSDLSDLSSDDETEEIPATSYVSNEQSEELSDSSSDDEPLSGLRNGSASYVQWKHQSSFSPALTNFTDPPYDVDSRADWKPTVYVQMYLDKQLFSHISHCTNVTSVAVNGKSLNTTAAEIERFIGACVFVSCVSYPRVRMFWQRGLSVPVLSEAISRDRFFRIRNSLKSVIDADISDETKKGDRLWKVRPVLDRVHRGCLELHRSRDISIDEQMIPFTGACQLRQYVPNKPNPIGLKNFVSACPDGLVVDFVVYQGANSFKAFPPVLKLGIGGTVAAHLAETFEAGTHVYCDRYFTSINLIQFLQSKEVYVTGTIMKNRVPAALNQLVPDKDLLKRGRGACDVAVSQDGNLALVKWFDNKPILMLSAVHAKDPEDDCRRWCKREKSM